MSAGARDVLQSEPVRNCPDKSCSSMSTKAALQHEAFAIILHRHGAGVIWCPCATSRRLQVNSAVTLNSAGSENFARLGEDLGMPVALKLRHEIRLLLCRAMTPELLFEEKRASTFGTILERARYLVRTSKLDSSVWHARFFGRVLQDTKSLRASMKLSINKAIWRTAGRARRFQD